jgi:hypothetical protein
MRNAPPSLPIVLPLGFLGVRAASLLWSLLMVASLWLAVRMIAAMHERRMSGLDVLGLTFAPALSCLISGQMALFVLLGLVLFLRLHGTRPFLAGASLWLCALKPQLFLPFGVALLAWIVVNRGYRILLGAASAFGLSTAVACVLDPPVWVHYARMMRAAQLETKLIPCVSTMLRLAIDPGKVWLQGVPAALGCVWALAYFRRHRRWDWIEHGSLLMLVSVAVAPYSWFMDQAVLLPALLHALYRNRSRGQVGPARAAERGHRGCEPPRRDACESCPVPVDCASMARLVPSRQSQSRQRAEGKPDPRTIEGGVTAVTGKLSDRRNPSLSCGVWRRSRSRPAVSFRCIRGAPLRSWSVNTRSHRKQPNF